MFLGTKFPRNEVEKRTKFCESLLTLLKQEKEHYSNCSEHFFSVLWEVCPKEDQKLYQHCFVHHIVFPSINLCLIQISKNLKTTMSTKHIYERRDAGDTIPINVLNYWENHLVETQRKNLNCWEYSPHNNCSFLGILGKTYFHNKRKERYLKSFSNKRQLTLQLLLFHSWRNWTEINFRSWKCFLSARN